MYEKILKILYNSGIYLLISFALLLITTSVLWIFGVSLLLVSFIVSFILGAFISYKLLEGSIKGKVISFAIAVVVLLVSIFVSGYVYDQSDDGNTYHKETVYMLKEGWNPIYDDYKEFAISHDFTYNHELWAEHYPKSTWILASAIYDITGNIETGKFYNLVFMYIAFVMFCYAIYKIFNKKILSILISLVAVVNPIMIAQMFSYYVDGFLGLLLYLSILYMFLFIKNDRDKLIKVILASIIIIISNIKFTGLAYCGLFCLGYYIYYALTKIKNGEKKILISNTIYFVIVVVISCIVVGSSSYLKNALDHGNPLYPLLGKDKVDIMTFLQPESFAEMSPIEKNFYSIFSQSANIGVFNNGEPELKIPFTFEFDELKQISYDTRIGGYGVYFSGIFIISIIIIAVISIDFIRKHDKNILIYLIPLIITVLLMLFLSDSWWARYAPQLYLFILVSLLLFCNYDKKLINIIFSFFVIIVLFNTVLCFGTFYYRDLPISGSSKIELDKNENKEINIYLSVDRFTGILANLEDRNIKYNVVYSKTDDMLSLYGDYAYYNVIND